MLKKFSLVLLCAVLSNVILLATSLPLTQLQQNQLDKKNEENRLNSQSQFFRRPTFDESSLRQSQNLKIPIEFIQHEIQKNPIQIQRQVVPHDLKQQMPPILQFTQNFQHSQEKPQSPQISNQQPNQIGQFHSQIKSPFQEMKFPRRFPTDLSQNGLNSMADIDTKPEYGSWVIYFPHQKPSSEDTSPNFN